MNTKGETQEPNEASQPQNKTGNLLEKLKENKVPIIVVLVVTCVAIAVIVFLLCRIILLKRKLSAPIATVSGTNTTQINVSPTSDAVSIEVESESEALPEVSTLPVELEPPEYNTISSNTGVGDFVRYGSYEQNNDLEDGKEPIEWLVLDKMDDRYLLITSKVIDEVCYNDIWTTTTWGNCSLRTWLNESFYEEAFSDKLKSNIDDTILPDKNGYSISDKVFILSSGELQKYYTSMEDRAAGATPYAEAQGVYVYTNGNSWWWVRDAGADPHYAVYVNCIGDILKYGILVFNNAFGVRPAIWVKMQ